MQQNLQSSNENTNLDLAQASSSSLPATQSKSVSLEALHSEPETRPKIKSRSRFSTAIRKLSGTRRKKDQADTPTECFISSGGEDTELPTTTATSTTDEKSTKKKTGLSKRFLLSSLSKKSKVSPKTSIDADEDNEERNAAIDAFLESEPTAKATEEDSGKSSLKVAKTKAATTTTPATTGPENSAKITSKQSKVQITISGKKLGKSPKTDLKFSTSKALTSEAEQTKKIEKPTESSAAKNVSTSSTEAAAKAKKKLKTKKISTSSHTPDTGDTGDETKSETKETTEKFLVTQSTRDTPPSERAPLKPTLSQSQAGNETPSAIRKPITKAAATLKSSPSLAQRFISSATKLKKPTASVEAELMHDLKATALHRGHRLPRPTAATTIASNQPPTITSTLTAAPSTSASLLTKPNIADDPPAYPPPPVPLSPALSPLARTPVHSTARQGEGSLTRPNSSATDDFLSSADSGNLLAATDGEQRPISQDLSDEAAEAALRLAGLSLRKHNTAGSLASNLSSSSDSPLTNSSRRHITYVSDPIPFDFERRRKDNLNFSTEAAEHAYDTDDMEEDMEPTVLTSASGEKREHLYKILVIGELGTGKTSFIKRYVHQFFSQNYRATIGVDFALKVLHWDADTIVRLQLWDIAGQERFGNMTRVYYKEAVGAFIVFDITRNATFDCVNKWKEDLDSKVQLPDGRPIPCILLANKCDQEKQGIATQPEKLNEYVRENGFASWFETSAKDNVNIDEAARALVNQILLNDKLIAAGDISDSGKLNLEPSNDADLKNKCSC